MKPAQLRWARSTSLLRAWTIIILGLLSLGIESSYAGQAPILPEPLLKQGTLPPEEADGPFHYWSRRKKYFLVIAVNQTDVPKTDLPFAQVDGQRVVNALTGLGYKPLDQDHPLLTGKEATSSAIMASLDEARKKEEAATLVIYYTGHGAVGPWGPKISGCKQPVRGKWVMGKVSKCQTLLSKFVKQRPGKALKVS